MLPLPTDSFPDGGRVEGVVVPVALAEEVRVPGVVLGAGSVARMGGEENALRSLPLSPLVPLPVSVPVLLPVELAPAAVAGKASCTVGAALE